MNISRGATTEATISELDPATNYSIEVAAMNNAGIGDYSVPIVLSTEGKVFRICPIYILYNCYHRAHIDGISRGDLGTPNRCNTLQMLECFALSILASNLNNTIFIYECFPIH